MLRSTLFHRILFFISLFLLISACSVLELPQTPDPPPPLTTLPDIDQIEGLALISSSPDYLTNLSFTPEEAQFFDLVDGAMQLTDAEKEMLAQNGFVISESRMWDRFIEGYAWIYWQDLPVLISSDSILHAVHQSYSDLLKQTERQILVPEMDKLLRETRHSLQQNRATYTGDAANLAGDVDTYLTVALLLLNREGLEYGTDGAYHFNKDALNAPDIVKEYMALAHQAAAYEKVDLLGAERLIDFTLFQPRGHYDDNPILESYFRAMSWLAHIDYRFVEYDPRTSKPKLNQDAIVSAKILQEAIDDAGQRLRWEQINGLIEVFAGRSDNMMLPDFDRFLVDTNLESVNAISKARQADLLEQLSTHDYGQQRITGNIIQRHINNPSSEPIPRPVSFALLGQRFSIDAYVMGNLVYDRMLRDGRPVERPFPSSLDVMYALGNDHALTHLGEELATWEYEKHLAYQRSVVDSLDASFWDAPIYNEWLKMIRALNEPTTSENYPQAMRTEAWADKTLQTQLASWAQLRHDNLLYTKQSFTTAQVACEYPTGYVEPYPDLYAALHSYAQTSGDALAKLDSKGWDDGAIQSQQAALTYFEDVANVAKMLQTLSEKELRLEEFTPQEADFVKSIIKQRVSSYNGCGGPMLEEEWDGWYGDLFFDLDDNPAVIADIHTNPTTDPSSSLYPPRVLHVATGPVVPIFMIVDTDEGPTLYVGPSFTYYEQITVGNEKTPPRRLTDREWREQLGTELHPPPPEWTATFRLPFEKRPLHLSPGNL